MAAGIGVLIAKKAPPPGKMKGYGGGMPEGDEEPGQSEEDETKEARVGMMQQFLDTIGIKVDPAKAEEACDAFDQYLDAAGYARHGE